VLAVLISPSASRGGPLALWPLSFKVLAHRSAFASAAPSWRRWGRSAGEGSPVWLRGGGGGGGVWCGPSCEASAGTAAACRSRCSPLCPRVVDARPPMDDGGWWRTGVAVVSAGAAPPSYAPRRWRSALRTNVSAALSHPSTILWGPSAASLWVGDFWLPQLAQRLVDLPTWPYW
jgi:hypothetical protein